MKIEVRKSYRCSNLVGMPVRNSCGEDVGKIEEVVLDLDQNRLIYAALSFGGFLGVGSKVFAIPWEALCLKFDERNTYFLLDVDPEQLKAAPGFHRENWPDMTDPNWAKEIDAYYHHERDQQEGGRDQAAAPPEASQPGEQWTEEKEEKSAAIPSAGADEEEEEASRDREHREAALASVR